MRDIKKRIANHPFFASLDAKHLGVLAEGAQEQAFEPGDVIVRTGQPAYHLYPVEEGKIVVEAHEPGASDTPVQTLGPGEVLGWSWLFAPYLWHLQARAVERTRTVRLDGGHLLARCEADHRLGYEVMKRVSQIVIARLQAVRKQGLEGGVR